jgi:dTDP-glucose 4,6-dehydratase
VCDNRKYILNKVDLADYKNVKDVFYKHDITHVVHFAAESHVDNSIAGPLPFIKTNIVGTFNLLECARDLGVKRFHHVSTDEVYGELGKTGKFKPNSPYDPKNPYSATKASSDMLVRAYGHTYGLPYTISNCSNNYGPRQHKEKFLPVVINSLLRGDKIPVYGKGNNIRDWIYVKDHCEAIWKTLLKGKLGRTYLVGSNCEKTNLQIIHEVCSIMMVDPKSVISFVEDRKGHDFRYAIDSTRIKRELGWKPKVNLKSGLMKTIEFYQENE